MTRIVRVVGRFEPSGGCDLQSDFAKLWVAQTLGECGTQVSAVAIPLVAAVQLQASPLSMGIVASASTAPFILFGFLAGAYVDRRSPRSVLLLTTALRAGVLLLIPLCWFTRTLTVPLLVLFVFAGGTLNVFFEVATGALLPRILSRADLMSANAKITSAQSAVKVIAPSLGGAMAQLLTASGSIFIDIAMRVTAAISVSAISAPCGQTPSTTGFRALIADVTDGLQKVFNHPVLRALISCATTYNFFLSILESLLIISMSRILHLSQWEIGVVASATGAGFLAGSLASRRIAAFYGFGKTLIAAGLLAGGGWLVVGYALAARPTFDFVLLCAGQALFGIGQATFNIAYVTVRQSVTPDELQGRVNASMRTLSWGMLPLGALVGGALGQSIGLVATMALAPLGLFLSLGWLVGSPVRRMRSADAY